MRIVVQRHPVRVAGLAAFVARNLPFVAQVALMDCEMTGLAQPNSPLVSADPADYQDKLAQAVDILATAWITTRIYNRQLCVLDQRLWPCTIRSIGAGKQLPGRLLLLGTRHMRQHFTQAATGSASACPRYRDQAAETGTQGTPPLTGLVFDLSEPHSRPIE